MDLIKKRFFLFPHCYLVKGAKRGAIYNLKTQEIYSIDSKSLFLLERLEKGVVLDNALLNIPGIDLKEALIYLKELEIVKLGKFVSGDVVIKKNLLEKPLKNLRFIWLEVTTSCNLKCVHCYASSSQKGTFKEVMKENNWEQVMKESYSLGCRRLQFIGGEPFCIGVDNLLVLIQKAKDIGYNFIEVYTNCTLVNKKALDFFYRNKVAVATSLYGSNAKIHDSITQQPGSFKKTIEIIKKIVKLRMPLRVGIIEMKRNKEDIKEIIKFLHGIGVQNTKVDIVRPSGRGCNKDLIDFDLLERQKRKTPIFSGCSFTTFQKVHYGHNCFSEKICVVANGDVLPCIMGRDIVLGNILEKSLGEIIFSERSQEVRNTTKDKIEICRDCEYRYCCFDCRIKAKNFYAKPTDCLYNPYAGKWAKFEKEMLIK